MKTLLFVCSLLLCLGITGCRQNEKELKITAYVNPFIGTDGHGHCFPGAILPFGGIQLSPVTVGTGPQVIIIPTASYLLSLTLI